ncbi:choice-of-anchor Q domain-containing protein [Luteolibacter sp. Populi]|uniref:choice-of-anchor Q domain-containing protein n=1 Tax=Luteolibacter sp. Populi TaxID=3230487 RepID=UPI0034671532
MKTHLALSPTRLALLVPLFAALANAETIVVTSLADSGAGSLRAAIAAAAAGDTIRITASGSLNLNSTLRLDRAVTIEGPGATGLKIRRGNLAAEFAVFTVTSPGAVALRGFMVTDGDAPEGGGGLQRKATGPLLIEDCHFIGNDSGGSGGAMRLTGGGTVTLRRCLIQHNICEGGSGGGIYLRGTTLDVSGTTFMTNGTHLYGGGLYLESSATANVHNCTFSGNSADRAGGAIGLGDNCWMNLLSSTVTLNSLGGGIHNIGGKVNVGNSILSKNGSATGGDYQGHVVSLGYNLTGKVAAASFNKPGDKTGVNDPGLNPLDYYGGSTPVHLPRPDSTDLIDRGNRSLGGVILNMDQHGKTRPVRAHWQEPVPGGDFSDIGAVELQESEQKPAVIVVNTTQDNDDGVAGHLHCTLREALREANEAALPDGTVIRFHPAVFGPGKPLRVIATGSELPHIMKRVFIQGPGAKALTVRRSDSARNFSVFSIGEHDAFGSISGLTVANGKNSMGGGIYVFSSGQLILTDCHVTGCHATYEGGAIFCKDGRVVIKGCTIFNNRSDNTNAAVSHGGGRGGAVLGNSTFQGNTSRSGPGIISSGGTMSLSSCTIVDNYPGGVSGVGTEAAITVRNCIITRNYKDDVGYKVTSGGFNIVHFPNSSFVDGVNADQTNVIDPGLGPLRDNGGPTYTMAVLPKSKALDKGKSFGLTVDQRGLPRPYDTPAASGAAGGDQSDIGAFESSPVSFETWRRLCFTEEQLASAASAPEGDANASGIANTLKHLFGLDPLLPMGAGDLGALPEISSSIEGGRSYLTVTYRKSAFYSGPSERVEISTDLVEWVPAVTERGNTGSADPETMQIPVSRTVDVTGMKKAYLRVAAGE